VLDASSGPVRPGCIDGQRHRARHARGSPDRGGLRRALPGRHGPGSDARRAGPAGGRASRLIAHAGCGEWPPAALARRLNGPGVAQGGGAGPALGSARGPGRPPHRRPADPGLLAAGAARTSWVRFTVAQIPGAVAWALIYSTIGRPAREAVLATATQPVADPRRAGRVGGRHRGRRRHRAHPARATSPALRPGVLIGRRPGRAGRRQDGAAPVDPRTTSSGRNTYSARGVGRPASSSSRARTAAPLIASTDWRMVVSGGSANPISGESS